MKVLKTVVAVGVGLLTVVGCSSVDNARTGEWVRTDRGDVYCLIGSASRGYKTTTCDWSSLVGMGAHTTSESKAMDGHWLKTERGEVYCLASAMSYGYTAEDCDWSTLRELAASE